MANEEAKELDTEIRKSVQNEVEEAERVPYPEPRPDILFEDMYVRRQADR